MRRSPRQKGYLGLQASDLGPQTLDLQIDGEALQRLHYGPYSRRLLPLRPALRSLAARQLRIKSHLGNLIMTSEVRRQTSGTALPEQSGEEAFHSAENSLARRLWRFGRGEQGRRTVRMRHRQSSGFEIWRRWRRVGGSKHKRSLHLHMRRARLRSGQLGRIGSNQRERHLRRRRTPSGHPGNGFRGRHRLGFVSRLRQVHRCRQVLL